MTYLADYIKERGLNRLQIQQIIGKVDEYCMVNDLKEKLSELFEVNPDKVYNMNDLYNAFDGYYDSIDIERYRDELVLDNKIQAVSGYQLRKNS